MSKVDRKKQRSKWPIRRFNLNDEPIIDDRSNLNIKERLLLAWQLSKEACELAKMPKPDYTRSSMPGLLIRSDD